MLLRPKGNAGWRLSDVTLRGESKTHYASLRMVVERHGLKFRLKQTFNDWWVPVSNEFNLRRVEGHALLGDEVVLTGRDYHGRPGACAQILGTTVESYLLEGMPTPKQWPDSFAALEAAVPTSVDDARKTSYAERNYWMRWNRDVGPWDSHEYTRPRWMRPSPDTFEKVSWASTPDRWAPMPGAPDSIASLDKKGMREIQVLFRQPMTLNYTSWLRVTEKPDPEGPVGRRDTRYPQQWAKTKVNGRDVEYAALQPTVGPWFFSWNEDGRGFELHVRAANGLEEEKAKKVLGSVLGT